MTTDGDGDRREPNAESDGDGGPTEGDTEQGTGFVVSLINDVWVISQSSSDVNAEVSYATRIGDRERVTVAVRVGEPIEGDE
jgi:hypothetical protein